MRSNSRPIFADPGATRPAAWRAVARAHLPSWAIFQGTPQPGGRLPHTFRTPQRNGKAQSVGPGDRRVRFCVSGGARVRLCVSPSRQSALLRRMRFSSPAQTSSHLTERRSLQPSPHGKAQPETHDLRKDTLWTITSHQKTRFVTLQPSPRTVAFGRWVGSCASITL